ncbi:hypothetical protein GCM10009574_101760 [Streptomyces asiaticus]
MLIGVFKINANLPQTYVIFLLKYLETILISLIINEAFNNFFGLGGDLGVSMIDRHR